MLPSFLIQIDKSQFLGHYKSISSFGHCKYVKSYFILAMIYSLQKFTVSPLILYFLNIFVY